MDLVVGVGVEVGVDLVVGVEGVGMVGLVIDVCLEVVGVGVGVEGVGVVGVVGVVVGVVLGYEKNV